MRRESFDRSNVTFKIEKHGDRHSATIRLIGRMRAEHLSELEKQISESESKIALDLEELNLVDVEAVRFLGMCETQNALNARCVSSGFVFTRTSPRSTRWHATTA